MISTKNDRRERARNFISVLLGSDFGKYVYDRKRPATLPKGLNYTTAEWLSINVTIQVLLSSPQQDISIQRLFELEEIEQKYRDHLFLAKLSV